MLPEIEKVNSKINNISDPHQRNLVSSIIKKKDWYLKVSLDTFINILMDLGYSKENAIILFKKINVME